jgi:hypothetical protein
MILKTKHIERFINNRLKTLTKSDLGVGAGNQTHIGLLEDSFDGWRDIKKINTYVLCDKKIFYSCSLIDPIKSNDGSLRSPKLRQGSVDELNGTTSTLLLIRDIAKPGDGISIIKVNDVLLILIIPNQKIISNKTVVCIEHLGIYRNKTELDMLNLNLSKEQILWNLELLEIQELILNTELADIVDDVRILNTYHKWSRDNLLEFILRTDRFSLRNWGLRSEYLFLTSIYEFINKNKTTREINYRGNEVSIQQNKIKPNRTKEEDLSINDLKKLEIDKLCRFYKKNYVSIWTKIHSLNNGNLSILQITNELGLEWPSNTSLGKDVSDYNYEKAYDLFRLPGLGNKKIKSLIISIYWASLGQEFSRYKTIDTEDLKQFNSEELHKFYDTMHKDISRCIADFKSESLLIQKIANEINLNWPSTNDYQSKKVSDYNLISTHDLFSMKGLGKKRIRTVILSVHWASLGKDFKKEIENIMIP